MSDAEATQEHGIDNAFYGLKAIGRYGEHRPQLACLCGFVTDNHEKEWAEAGAEFDEHLATTDLPARAQRSEEER